MRGARFEAGALAAGGTLFAFWRVAGRTTHSPPATESLSTQFHREPLLLEHLRGLEGFELFGRHRGYCCSLV